MKKIWKSKAYKNTKIDFIKSQISINKILLQNGIKDVQHTQMANKSQIVFMKELKIEDKSMKIGTFGVRRHKKLIVKKKEVEGEK